MNYADDDDDDEDDEEEADIVYDDDEDEFGLPSISSMRRKPTKGASASQPKAVDPGGSGNGAVGTGSNATSLGYEFGNNRNRANSSDIAEERGTPMYPSARKGDGKILRPQYKEILRGKSGESFKQPTNLLTLILQIQQMP